MAPKNSEQRVLDSLAFADLPGNSDSHEGILAAAYRAKCDEAQRLDAERRWSNHQIDRIASALGVPEKRSDEVADCAVIVIEAYLEMGTAMIADFIKSKATEAGGESR